MFFHNVPEPGDDVGADGNVRRDFQEKIGHILLRFRKILQIPQEILQ